MEANEENNPDSTIPDLIDGCEVLKHIADADILTQVIDEERIKTKAKFGLFFNESFDTKIELLKFEYDYDSVVVVPYTAPFIQKIKRKTRKPFVLAEKLETKTVRVENFDSKTNEFAQATEESNLPQSPQNSKVETKNETKSAESKVSPTKQLVESSLLHDLANFEPRKIRTRQYSERTRQNSGQSPTPLVNGIGKSVVESAVSKKCEVPRTKSRTSPVEEVSPNKRIRRSSSRVPSPLIRYGSSGTPVTEKTSPVATVIQSPEIPTVINATTNITFTTREPSARVQKRSPREPTPKSVEVTDAKTEKPRTRNDKVRPVSESESTKRKRNDSNRSDLKKDLIKKTKPLKGVTGLKNLGNTCYLNTIVQVLASLKCFRVALSEVESAINQNPVIKKEESPKRSNPPRRKRNMTSLTKSLQKLVNELSAGNKKTVEPSYFVQAVNEQMPSFKGHLQQDVQEFFCQLLSKLNHEKAHPDPGCSEEILNCVVNRMFTGAWQSEVTCIGCGNSNQNKEQFNTLPLEFPNKYHKMQTATKSITLDHLLQFYTQSERLGRVYNCVNCTSMVNGRARRTSVRTEAAKRITVLESPKCLFVHLKRAKYSPQMGQEKITCHVEFPETLNLGPYMTHADKENNPEYLLRAVVVHHGKYFSSGHYTTFCWIDNQNKKNNHSGWVEYNDSEVHPAGIKDVLSSQAYMLLYVDRDLANEI